MPAWTTSNIDDQSGRTFVITGANSGLGAATARALAANGAGVVLACRNVDKAAAVAREIGPAARVESLDLANLASIRAFAARIESVDVLINNAGVMATPLLRTSDGFEMQFGTNHLGHFLLTGLLLPRVAARVVTVSSAMHWPGKIDLDDPNYERRRYERWSAYAQSKLANLMFAKELARRLAAVNSPVLSLSAHPGYAATNLQSHTASKWMGPIMQLGNLLGQSPESGAWPQEYAATSPAAVNGTFYGPKDFGGWRGSPTVSRYASKADDLEVASELWKLSERLTGLSWNPAAA